MPTRLTTDTLAFFQALERSHFRATLQAEPIATRAMPRTALVTAVA